MTRPPSRTNTSNPTPSPSRLTIPILRQSPSLSNLHIHRDGPSPGPSAPIAIPALPALQNHTLDSSSSSMSNVDLSEGILVQADDAEVDTADDATVIAHLETNAGDESSKKSLRDQLRRTLSHRLASSEATLTPTRTRRKSTQMEMDELAIRAASRYPPREYFVLTDAGKPVFISRPGTEEHDNMASTIGIMQALISVFIDDGDKLRCIVVGNTRITFLIRSPLYYACASSWGEPESVTRSHLEYLHLQILSVVTASHLRKIFEKHTNFDLRRLLDGAEPFMVSLLDRLEFDLAMNTSSLHCLKLEPSLRKQAADTLIPAQKMKDVLYVILIARGRVITLIRPKKHSIHPADIHILLNTVHSPAILNSPAASSWIPVCLPKFNPSGFVNAYISFLRKDDGLEIKESSTSPPNEGVEQQSDSPPTVTDPRRSQFDRGDSGVALIYISGGGEFDAVRTWCDAVTHKLETEGILDSLVNAYRSGKTEYSVSELGIFGLRHFVYKSRAQVQVTFPTFEDPYDNTHERRRLITLYQHIYDAIHAKSGQEGTLKLQYLKTDKESVMGWITQPFELYIALSPRLPKSAVVGAANAVTRWVKKEESRLFLRDAPVF